MEDQMDGTMYYQWERWRN